METVSYRIADWEQTKWLVISSSLFLIPAVYSLYKGLYLWSFLLCMTTLISVNYWRDAEIGWRRDLDLWFAKFIFCTFCAAMVYYVEYVPYAAFGYTALFLVLFLYYKSVQSYYYQHEHWWVYHALFHVFLTLEQCIIVDSIV